MSKKKQLVLIFICWVCYTFAQLGRYSYSSNVTLLMDKFSLDHATVSIPSTLFFFSYGIGQILVGAFCNKFNRKRLITVALILSGFFNILVFLGISFFAIKYLWFLNGLAQANLWPILLLILSENLSEDKMPLAMVLMSTASTGGKFLAMGICAIFAINVNLFMYCFLTAGLLLIIFAIIFFFCSGDIKKPIKKMVIENSVSLTPRKKTNASGIILLLLLGELSLASYAISGGLQSWVPSILKENYGLSDAISIFMSILLPLFTLPVAVISPLLYKIFKNYILISLMSFIIGTLLIVGVLMTLNAHWLPVLVLFTLEAIIMGIVSNTTTVQVPLTLNEEFNAGFLAGFLNGAAYLGMAISTYVLGALADISGWVGAFIMLIIIASFSAFLSIIYMLFTHKKHTNC